MVQESTSLDNINSIPLRQRRCWKAEPTEVANFFMWKVTKGIRSTVDLLDKVKFIFIETFNSRSLSIILNSHNKRNF